MEINQNLHSSKKKNNTIAIIIVLIVIAFTIAGYFAFKYFLQKNNNPSVVTSVSPTARQAVIRNKEDLINLLRYPQAETITNGKKISDSQIDDFTMQTEDNVAVTYTYYMNLLSEYNWALGASQINTDQTSGRISIEEKDFQAEIYIDKNTSKDKTDIIVDIKTGEFTPSQNHNYQTALPTVSPKASTDISPSPISNTDGKNVITTDYVISDSNTRVIEKKELENLSPWDLKVARNEIYARHGREFAYEDMKCYFGGKNWYAKNSNFNESDLSSTEIKNISIILEYEKEIDSQVMSKDLGC